LQSFAAEKILDLPARQGLPQNLMGSPEIIAQPTYATALGLLAYQSLGDSPRIQRGLRRSNSSLMSQVKNFLTDLF